MLFKDTAKLKEYAELGEVNFASITPTLRMVELGNLVPVIGPELYGWLNEAYTNAANEAALTDAQKKLLDKCRQVVAPYVVYNYVPKSEVLVSDAGTRRMETANAKTAYGNQVVNLREQKLTEAETATELLLQFLELNKDDYSTWTNSDTFKAYRGLFIKSGAELAECFTCHVPYRNYMAIRSKMVDVEDNIRELLGDTLFNALKTKAKLPAPNFSDKEKQLLFFLRRAVANLAFAAATPYLAIRFDANGVTVISNNSAGRTKDYEIRQAAGSEEKSAFMNAAANAGKEWIDKATKYLNANYADFTGWPAPPTAPQKEFSSGNDELRGTFGLI